jgi:hypothetical protein
MKGRCPKAIEVVPESGSVGVGFWVVSHRIERKMIGKFEELDRWNPVCGLELGDAFSPVWTGIGRVGSIDTEFKGILCMSDSRDFWEPGPNHPLPNFEMPTAIAINGSSGRLDRTDRFAALGLVARDGI